MTGEKQVLRASVTYLQNRSKGQSRELQTGQSHSDSWENLEASPLAVGRCFWAYKGMKVIWNS